MNWYLEVLRKYAVFTGRARRKEYWFFVLFNVIFLIILSFLDRALGTFNMQSDEGLLTSIYWLTVLIPAIAVGDRRLHFIGHSCWCLVQVFIPVICTIIIIVLIFFNNQRGDHTYSENP